MRGLVLSGVGWPRWRRLSVRRGVAGPAAAVLLLCLLGVLCLAAHRRYNAGGRSEDVRGRPMTAPAFPDTKSWLERFEAAGLEAWPPRAPDLRPNDTAANATATATATPRRRRPAAGPFRYIINEENKCPAGGGEGEEPFLVLLITVEAHQVDRRDAIRRTWGAESPPAAPGPRVVRLFLLGVKEEGEEPGGAALLEEESRRHGDILQQDFADTYRILTAKTLMGLNWVARHCPRAAYVMKTDSDIFVNTEYLVHELLRWRRDGVDVTPRRNLFTGALKRDGPPTRDKDSKWYVSEEEYPSPTYPRYCIGTGYVFSGELAARIYGGSLGVPRFPFEDVHVGMVLERLGVPVAAPPSPSPFHTFGLRPFSVDGYGRLVTSHHVTPAETLDFWRRLRPAAEARYRRRRSGAASSLENNAVRLT